MEHPALFWTFNVLVACAAVALTIYCARIRKGSGKYLCEDCRFNDPRSCLKKERPYALVCSSYRDSTVLTGGNPGRGDAVENQTVGKGTTETVAVDPTFPNPSIQP